MVNVILDFAVDWTWFSALGDPDVFWTAFGAKVLSFLTVFAATTIMVWWNSWLAFRPTKPDSGRTLERAGMTMHPSLAAGETANWYLLLRFVYQLPYGQR